MPPEDASRAEGESGGGRDWSDKLAYGDSPEAAIPEYVGESDHWDRWHYGIYLGALLLVVGVVRLSLPVMLAGYLIAPTAIYLDARYLDSVTPTWQPDYGLYLVGTLLFPVLTIPMYLYRRRELRVP
jgi:hypothetical protein